MEFQKILLELLEGTETAQVLEALRKAENYTDEFREVFGYTPARFSKQLLRYLEYGQFNLHLQGP